MDRSLWLILSLLAGTLLGVVSNLIATLVEPRLRGRKSLLLSLFAGLLSFTIIATMFSQAGNDLKNSLPNSLISGELIYAENGNWILRQLSNGSTKRLPLPKSVEAGHPAWSADGKQLLFYWEPNHDCNGSLQMFNLVDQTISPILTLPDLDIAQPSWSPDGTTIAFTVVDSPCIEGSPSRIYTYELKTGKTQRLTDAENDASKASWSPESREIVYEARPTPNGPSRIFIMDKSGQNKIELTGDMSGEQRQPSWSPNSSQIAFVLADIGIENIWVMDIDTGEKRAITSMPEGRNAANPVWSPDGKWIAFFSNQENDPETSYGNIYITNLERSILYRITDSNSIFFANFSWRPDVEP